MGEGIPREEPDHKDTRGLFLAHRADGGIHEREAHLSLATRQPCIGDFIHYSDVLLTVRDWAACAMHVLHSR